MGAYRTIGPEKGPKRTLAASPEYPRVAAAVCAAAEETDTGPML